MDTDFQQRLKDFEEKKDKEAEEKLKNLEKDFPLQERVIAVEQMKAKERLNKELLELEEYKEKTSTDLTIGESISWADLNEDSGKREWIWENYIAKGHTTLLSALWKAGKSTLLRHLFLAIAEEKEFAGQPTKKSRVLVISEETKNEWFDKKDDIDPELIKDIIIKIRPLRIKPNIKQWIEFIEILTQECIDINIDMVVIDTLSTFWPLDNENDSAQVMKALVPLYNFTENNIAVLLIHHFRKGGGDQAQASRGSGALPGFVDNIIEFTRNDNGTFSQRILRTYGRFDEVIPSVLIELTPEGEYITRGEPWKFSKNARVNRCIDFFAQYKDPLTAKEVFNLWSKADSEMSLRSIQRIIKELTTVEILEVKKEDVVVRKKTPFYALTRDYENRRQTLYPLGQGGVVSSVSVASVSSVDENRAGTDDTTGTSVYRENVSDISKIIEENKLDKEIERADSIKI